MRDDEFSGLPKSALRNYADDPRIERIWRRLDTDGVRQEPRARASLWLVPATGVLLFALGVFVGRHSTPPASIAEMSAEPPQGALPAQQAEAPALPGTHVPEAPPAASDRRRPLPARATHALAETHAQDESASAPAPVLNTMAPSGPPSWQEKADAGDFSGARVALEQSGGWDAALSAASPEQLMTLVDVARASGEREPAVRALRRLLSAHADAPEAPLAAWTLGNVLEQGGDSSGAAEAYALYRRLSPAGDFAEDAAAREVDVALGGGNYEAAAPLVEQYAKDFPAGRRLGEFREELQKLEAARAAGAAAPSVSDAPAVAPAPASPAPPATAGEPTP